MNQQLEYVVQGVPKAEPRKRAIARKYRKPDGTLGYRGAVAPYKPKRADTPTVEQWKAVVAGTTRLHWMGRTITGPVRVRIWFVLPRPQEFKARRHPDGQIVHTRKPDLDNLAKPVLDALTNLGVWADDNQVAELHCVKHYAARDGAPGATIRIEELPAID